MIQREWSSISKGSWCTALLVVIAVFCTFVQSSSSYECVGPSHFECTNHRCISMDLRCDGDDDCNDGSDEHGCNVDKSKNETCASTQFDCGQGQCIPRSWVCDGNADCEDGKDEGAAGCAESHCAASEWECPHNHRCIPNDYICDGDDDCGDNSDEDDCTGKNNFTECTSAFGKFLCKNRNQCIDDSLLCNGHPDCKDGSDEGGHCASKAQVATDCAKLNCTHSCVESPDGPVCVCGSGYHLEGNVCEDINECLEWGTCDQMCENTVGGYICECEPGYKLESNGRTCKAEEGEGLLIYSSLKKIKSLYLTSRISMTVASEVPYATGVSFDGKHVYWTTVLDGVESIVRASEDGSHETTIVDSGVGSPEDLAVDWVTGNIYFTDGEYQQIGICTYNEELVETKCAVLHNKDLNKPRAIVLNPADAVMYWSDWGFKPLIARSGMDGTDFYEFVTTELHWPNGLTIDHGNRRVYWVDARLGTVETVDFQGRDRRKILTDLNDHPFAIAVFEDKIYWSGWTNQEIVECNKFTGKNRVQVVKSRKDKIYGVHIFHPTLQNHSLPNPCAGKCSDICALSPSASSGGKGYSCLCPDNKILSPSGEWCQEQPKESVIVSIGNFVFQLKVTLGKQYIHPLPVNNLQSVSAIVYNSFDGSLLIADPDAKMIYSYQLNTDTMETLIDLKVGYVSALAYDPIGRNLYWCDKEAGTVEVFSFFSHRRKLLLREFDDEKPFAMTLIPEEGLMFVIAKAHDHLHIDRINMDGSLSTLTHMTSLKLQGPDVALHYDSDSRRVYWADHSAGLIESTDTNGNDRQVYRDVSSPLALTDVDRDLYWTSDGRPHLYYSEKANASMPVRKINMERFLRSPKDHYRMFVTAIIPDKTTRDHPCQTNNGKCSHFCLLTSRNPKHVCSCPDGMKLADNGQDCEEIAACGAHEYHCTTGECIPMSKKCDRNKDCPYGEDETFCPAQCETDQFACFDGQKCIDAKDRCNMHFDCHDHSDEANCQNVTCDQSYNFLCRTGECVSHAVLCNNEWNCKDGSDEENCTTSTCPSSEFRCHSGTCIPKNWVCDLDADCPDQSDENNCSFSRKEKCTEFLCQSGMCVAQELVCNGQTECDDGSDEFNCDEPVPKTANKEDGFIDNCDEEKEFMCEPGKCINLIFKCNGVKDCENGADELNCIGCEQFTCNNGKCITYDLVCNDDDDCGDSSDERPLNSCPDSKENPAIVPAHIPNVCHGFVCKNGECLDDFSLVCNKKQDCKDGSDEGGRCGSSCDVTANCSQICRDKPNGHECACVPGFKIAEDGRDCEDIDECTELEPCSQMCFNTYGSYTCACLGPDYIKKSDGSCKATGPKLQYVFATGYQIRTISYLMTDVKVAYYSADLEVSGFDVNMRTEHVYWSSENKGVITKMSLTHRHEPKHFITGLRRPSELAVDWITHNLYFVQARNIINVCNFHLERCAQILTAESGLEINSLAVDPVRGVLFWSETSRIVWNMPKSSIRRADMNGKNIETIVSANVSYALDLALDPILNHVYWVDKTLKVIERANYDGTRRRVILTSKFHPKSVALFDGSIYWSVESSGSPITKCALQGLSTESYSCNQIPIKVVDPITHFTLMQPALQRNISNACRNMECSHMCVLSSTLPSCICRNGKIVPPKTACTDSNYMPETHFLETTGTVDGQSPGYSWSSICATIILVAFIGTTFYALFYYYNSKYNMRRLFPSIHFKNPAFNLQSKFQANGMTGLASGNHMAHLSSKDHHFENPLQESREGEVRIVTPNEITISRAETSWTSAHLEDSSSIETEYADLVVETNPKANLIS
ncbi:unnamed protein product [Bemisia tabaci]|uniref:EGF-like domain-containing protein n=1 Tax=Bemisia tabaci TaxID=7038 RepID=A0A9P0A9E8_BEMTA|nr:unnamed protein product [Bemisia tabaci]